MNRAVSMATGSRTMFASDSRHELHITQIRSWCCHVDHHTSQLAPKATVRPLVNDNRKRAVERFAFTQVFEEDAHQTDIFKGTGIVPMLEGVLGAPGHHGRDGLLATLGVTGSGKV